MGGLSSVNIIQSGLDAASSGLGIIGNNLANSNTVGFKGSRPLFGDLLTQAMGQTIGSGVMTQAVQTQFTQGTFQATSNPLDLGISGDGFFIVRNPNGTMSYTRDGEFSLDKNNYIVNPQGLILQGPPGDLFVPPDAGGNLPVSLQVDQYGMLNATYPSGQVTKTQILLAKFNAPTQLQNMGNNLYSQTAGSGVPVVATPGTGGTGTIQGSSLEASNVNMENEFVNMISLQNAFQSGTTVLNTTNEMFTSMLAETT